MPSTAPKLHVTQAQYDAFPKDFDVVMSVMEHYQSFVFEGNGEALSPKQSAFTHYYLIDGMYQNGGAIAILIESLGAYNTQYLAALESAGCSKAKENFEALVAIFKDHEEDFMDQNVPPALDEDEPDDFDQALADRLDDIENEWYDQSDERNACFATFLAANKDALLDVQ
jgi:hypothetical protein